MLDLVITQSIDNIVSNTVVSDILRYHAAIHRNLNMPKPQPLRQTIQYRNESAIDNEMFQADIEASTLCLDPATSAASLLDQYDDTMSALLDKHAPLQTRTITVRPKVTWFNGGIKMAKQKRRQLERRWRQSVLTILLDMFKEQKRHVNKLISSANSSYNTAKIIEDASDQNQLYNVVNTMAVKPEASLPNGSSLEQLASEFEIFVQTKFKRIQENLVSDADYVPPAECPCAMGAKLDILLPATEDEEKLLRVLQSGVHLILCQHGC